jgi:hypothetical protein
MYIPTNVMWSNCVISELHLPLVGVLEWRMDHGGCQVQEIRLQLSLTLPAESARKQILGQWEQFIYIFLQ